MSTARLVAIGVAAGLVVGVVAFLALGPDGGVDGDLDPGPSTTARRGPPPSAGAADAFVAAQRRSRTGTYVVVEDFVREVAGKAVLSTRTTRVQRGGDLVVRAEGSVEVVAGGRRTGCAQARDEQGQPWRCKAEAAPSGASDVAADMASLDALVGGANPLYLVGEEARGPDGCFTLTIRVVGAIAPPFGRFAELCFDRATGAARSAIVERDGPSPGVVAVDTTTAGSIRAEVTDADFALPPGATFE